MSKNLFCSLLAFAAILFGGAVLAEDSVKVSKEADRALKKMCEFLGSLEQFGFHAENSIEVVLDTGMKLQEHRSVDVSVRRPDKIRADAEGDREDLQFYYNGNTVTLYDKNTNFYASAPAPPEIDAAMDFAKDTFNLRAPLAELIYADSCKRILDGVKEGYVIGKSKIDGVECLHLAFREDHVDWQIWIQTEEESPFPRKVVITDRRKKGSPQFTALVGSWRVGETFPDDLFEFAPPDNAKKIDFLPVEEPEKKSMGHGGSHEE